MIKRIRFLLFVLIVGCSFSVSAQESADMGTATLNDNFCLTLNTDETLHEYYFADISAFEFATELDLAEACGVKSNNLITYTADFANNQVIAHLHLNRTGESKDLDWWNQYLLSVCEVY